MKSARYFVLNALEKMSENNSYSNILLDKMLDASEFSRQDKNFASFLFYGVLERNITLEYVISCYVNKPLSKLDSVVVNALKIGIYQLLYMDSVPENAAVNESVELVKQFKKASASGMVNAILRSFIRDDKQIKLPKGKIDALSIEYSTPKWLVQKWIANYGEDEAIGILSNSISHLLTTIRVNSLKTTSEQLKVQLAEDNIHCENTNIENCLIIKNAGDIEKISAYKEGLFHVQDISSQLCCLALGAKETDIVLDLCAAPGGKTFTIAELMGDKGEIRAFDLHEKRVNLIKVGAERLGITSIIANVGNAKVFDESLPLADKILCDVPCAGFGVTAKKPEIKNKTKEEVAELPRIQYEILENAVKYLKVGGEIIYSTCSLSKDENDDVVEKFLLEHQDFEGISFLEDKEYFGSYKLTVFPRYFNSDGFFIAKFKN